jgi:hypothetical protein
MSATQEETQETVRVIFNNWRKRVLELYKRLDMYRKQYVVKRAYMCISNKKNRGWERLSPEGTGQAKKKTNSKVLSLKGEGKS